MAAVDIGRLRLRGPPHLAARTAFLLEDACRTEIPDSEKLILVRRLDLAAGPGKGGAPAAALRRAYDEATQRARHGGDDGAAGANCVWFASRAEARRLLLAALLAGRRPEAWYWRLAVPDWRGRPLGPWLGALLAAALAGDGEPDLLDIVTLAVEADAVEVLLRLLAEPAGGAEATAPGRAAAAAISRSASPVQGAGEEERTDSTDLRGAVIRLRGQLPAVLVERVEIVIRRIGPRSRPAARLIERLLVAASPPLVLAPPLLRELGEAYAGLVADPPVGRPPIAAAPPPGVRSESGEPAPRPAMSDRPRKRPAADPAAARFDRPSSVGPEAKAAPAEAPAIEVETPLLLDEHRSPAAGLWLAIPSLIRMGLREWLAERPDLLCGDPGRTLLRAIARHHRVDPDDPALRPLPADDDASPEWARLWRVGLDRWLRRRARVPLARLVWRPGWIRLSEDRLVVRFAPGDADIRLRRRALDVDPGWTDWLGLSVRYAFAERPAP